jgi:hypothetical protein
MATRSLALAVATLLSAACEPRTRPPGGYADDAAALPPKESGERLEKVRAALRYRRAAEQRGRLDWQDGDAGRTPVLLEMYLQGAEDLGELTLVRRDARTLEGSVTILARGPGAAHRCRLELRVGTDTAVPVRAALSRLAAPPSGLRVEMDRFSFRLGLDDLQRLAAAADSGGQACGLAFTFTRAQRDRLDRIAGLFGSAGVDDDAMEAVRAAWSEDRPPGPDGGFQPTSAVR